VRALEDDRRANARNLSSTQNARLVSPRVLTAALRAGEGANSATAASPRGEDGEEGSQQEDGLGGEEIRADLGTIGVEGAESLDFTQSALTCIDDNEMEEAAAVAEAMKWLRQELANQS